MSDITHHRTPVSKDYKSCYECYASILIYPAAIHPDEITDYLKQQPTLSEVIGEEVTNSICRKRKVKYSIWKLCSEGFVKSRDLREHIDWLLDKMVPRNKELKKLQEVSGLSMYINCVWRGNRGYGGPVLWPAQMKRISYLDIECAFDVYFFNED
ncbi:DUF4279 domain-containing protein [Rosenbergiella collisarenosi]|uniref:DUF4279 domain-containing protein n=1 Tax=Rosenbergiella collisarenosi TaxID=1544695 RepID=UPI001BDB381E|nr:DUF4279 domain-containing protein [Rosenbergiella collisarenosi]MBT0721508.1 DUF4279 domain-containing protein [Rosenbergiella collisarenosi]